MATKNFGLMIPKKRGVDTQDIAARLFLCPRISAEQATRMLKMLSNEKLSLKALNEKTEEWIAELKRWKDNGDDITVMMNSKLEDWTRAFGAPSEGDLSYLKNKYGFDTNVLFGEMKTKNNTPIINTAQDFADYVKQYIKGQDKAIEELAVPFFLHLDSKRRNSTCRIVTPVLLMGPTGVGKSEVLRIFSNVCDCPVIRINTSKIQPNGWKGFQLADFFTQQLSEHVTVDDLKYAVIVFHEFDKITHYGQRVVGNNGTDMDADMMRLIMSLFETDEYLYFEYGYDSNVRPVKYKLPVDNLLIVFDGAFNGIEPIIRRRLNIGTSIGFSGKSDSDYEDKNILQFVKNEDLIEWGYMPELVGRIGNVVVMNPLSTDDMFQILTTAKGSILQKHFDYFNEKNVELQISDDALYYIADEAHKSGMGFRNVKTLLYKALKRLYYEMPRETLNKRVVKVNKDYVMRNICEQEL